MSKRAGDFVTLREVVDEVGRDAARFMMIFRKNDAPLDFDLAKVIEQSKDNPVFYVQYAHARCASVFRQAGEAFPGADFSAGELAKADLSILSDEAEMDLVHRIAQFPGPSRRRRRLTNRTGRVYLCDLAGAFHSLWNKGKDLPQLRFVNPTDKDSTQARLRSRACPGRVCSHLVSQSRALRHPTKCDSVPCRRFKRLGESLVGSASGHRAGRNNGCSCRATGDPGATSRISEAPFCHRPQRDRAATRPCGQPRTLSRPLSAGGAIRWRNWPGPGAGRPFSVDSGQ